jgi:hypothetical protein
MGFLMTPIEMNLAIKDIYLQLLGFNNGKTWGRFRLVRRKGKRLLAPVRKGSHKLRRWDIDHYSNIKHYSEDQTEMGGLYAKYGIFK